MDAIHTIIPDAITTVEDVRKFIKLCHAFFKGGFHFDESFKDYQTSDTERPGWQKKTFTNKQAKQLEKVMDKCFIVCESNQQDITDIVYEITIEGKG